MSARAVAVCLSIAAEWRKGVKMYYQNVLFGQAAIEIPVVEAFNKDAKDQEPAPIHPNQGTLF